MVTAASPMIERDTNMTIFRPGGWPASPSPRRRSRPGVEGLETRLLLTVDAHSYPIPIDRGSPVAIAAGADGNLWVSENGPAGGLVVRVAADGSMTPFPDPSGLPVRGIAAGPGGDLWFVESGPFGASRIGRIAPDGQIVEFPTPDAQAPGQIAAGPDGNFWFTQVRQQGAGAGSDRGIIGRVTPSGIVTEFPLPSDAESLPTAIADGPDGNLWFTDGAGRIGRISPGGAIAEFPIPSAGGPLYGIAPGPDGNVWFTEFDAGKIGKITPDGQITEFSTPLPVNPTSIAAGADGNLWFLSDGMAGGSLGRITTSGIVTLFALPAGVSSSLQGIAAGPGGTLWFDDVFNNAVVRADPNAAPLPSRPPPGLPAGVPGSSQESGGPAPSPTVAPTASGPVAVVAPGLGSSSQHHRTIHVPARPHPHPRPHASSLAAHLAALRRYAIAHGARPYP